MPEFPAAPIAAADFMEEFLPKAFAEAELPDDMQSASAKLGVTLRGDGGGEWLFHIHEGSLDVTPGKTAGASMTLVQSVTDWRGALWEGRGGAIGRGAMAIFRPGEAPEAAAANAPGAPSLAVFDQLGALSGMIQMVVSGGEGGDWSIGMKLGAGEIPANPTTTVTISAEDAEAMEKGTLDPMTAFMSGKIQVAGDMTLMMQMQAIQMQAAAAAAQNAAAQKKG